MKTPKYLYHYTSQKGLLGILGIKPQRSKPYLWITDIRYLNDSSEYTHTIDLVKSELMKQKILYPPRKGMSGSELSNKEIKIDIIQNIFRSIEEFCDYFRDMKNYRGREIYVFSLSEEKDDLSQWRLYCPKEGGFCIEFDYLKLSSVIDNNSGYKLKKCIYNSSVKEDMIKEIFSLVRKSFDSHIEENRKDICIRTYLRINDISSYIKHDSFNKEQEHRIIHEVNVGEEIKYREGNSMIIPYIEFSPVDENGKFPISKINVGPTQHQELSMMSVYSLLKSNGYDIEVESSKIPYRSW